MRILLVSHYAVPHQGGIEVLAQEFASELAQRGHDVTHVASSATRDGEASPGDMPSPEYALVRVSALNFLESRWGVPYPLFSPSLIRVLRREVARADVVHVHGFLYPGTLTALAIARRRGAATVLTEHTVAGRFFDQLFRRPGYTPYGSRVLEAAEGAAAATLGRWSLRKADAVVVFNETVRRMVARLAPAAQVTWIDNGIDTELFRPADPRERAKLRKELGWDDRPRVLFVGRAVAKKGFDVALDALRAGEGAFALAVAGREPASGEDGVESLGVLPRERLAVVYRAADVLLVPSRHEGMPVAVQEALASGLPVVATDDPGYRETLRDAGPAVTLLPADGRSMGRALAELLHDSSASVANARAVAFARERFSRERCADRHEQLYAELLAAGPGQAPADPIAAAAPPRKS